MAQHDPIRTTRLEIVDDAGRVRAVVGGLVADSSVVGLALLDDEGHERVSLSLAQYGPALSFSLGGNVILEVGIQDPGPDAARPGPYLVLTDQDGLTAFECHVSPKGEVSLLAPNG